MGAGHPWGSAGLLEGLGQSQGLVGLLSLLHQGHVCLCEGVHMYVLGGRGAVLRAHVQASVGEGICPYRLAIRFACSLLLSWERALSFLLQRWVGFGHPVGML